MTWLMPVHLLPFAGLLALVVAWPRISKPTSHVRLFVEVLIIGGWDCCCRYGGVVRLLVDRATLVSRDDRPVLARDLAGTAAYAGVDPTLVGRALQDALRREIAHRRGYCSWTVDHASWVVTLHSPDEEIFCGRTLEEALAWCLVWLMAPEIGVGPFRV